jgi:hypothetical protein
MPDQRPASGNPISDQLRRDAASVRAEAADGGDAPGGEYADGLEDAADIVDRMLAPLGPPAEAARAEAWREVASWIRHQCAHQFGASVCADCLELTARIDAFADQMTKGAYDPPTVPL